mmetsp:Transcript_33940/g.62447  ORF Transcript_33940/g.62447 Transcript_33940/m.62447 type:complete len:248 (+) Transcript_33940:583-1326(+)
MTINHIQSFGRIGHGLDAARKEPPRAIDSKAVTARQSRKPNLEPPPAAQTIGLRKNARLHLRHQMKSKRRRIPLVTRQHQRRSLRRRRGITRLPTPARLRRQMGLVRLPIQPDPIGGIRQPQPQCGIGPVLFRGARAGVGGLELLVACEDFGGDEGAASEVALEEVDARVVDAGDEGGVDDSVFAGACDVDGLLSVLHSFGAAVRAADADLVDADGVAFAHAGCGNVFGGGDEDFNAVSADEAVEGG